MYISVCVFETRLRSLVVLYSIVFFFFKQKTAYEMRISDWSSDVCSSDLEAVEPDHALAAREQPFGHRMADEARGAGHQYGAVVGHAARLSPARSVSSTG